MMEYRLPKQNKTTENNTTKQTTENNTQQNKTTENNTQQNKKQHIMHTLHELHAQQSCVKIEGYSIAHFDQITVFEAPYC